MHFSWYFICLLAAVICFAIEFVNSRWKSLLALGLFFLALAQLLYGK